ncbi:MAG: FHA domain-containing protein [Clostridia bacterium]|nr:FHA domain-containing protein [Clostridia bacterium]
MKKLVALILTVALALCAAVPALAAKYDINEAKKSVVRIVVEYKINDDRAEQNGMVNYMTGSGFALGKLEDSTVEFIATAGHVIGRNFESGTVDTTTSLELLKDGSVGFVKIDVNGIYVLLDDIDHYVQARYERALPTADVALIRLNTSVPNRRPAVLTNRTEFELGEQLTAMGFTSAASDNLDMTALKNLISGTDQVSVQPCNFSMFDVNASTQAGDQITVTGTASGGISGGPLVDKNGYVVGVNVSSSVRNNNMNYAVTTGELLKLLAASTDVKYELGPVKEEGLSTTMIIIIAAAGVAIIALILSIILTSRGKKNSRTLVFGASMGGKTVPLKKNSPVVIGRDPNRCQVVYPKTAPGVSSVHCTITFDGNQVLVADNGSSYGTFVGGEKVEPGKPMVMHRGQEVSFGSDKNTAALQ